MFIYFLVFWLVVIVNVIPFFMPSTWTMLTFVAIRYPIKLIPLVLVGAVAATLGRVILLKLSRLIVRQNLMSAKTKKNIDVLKDYLEKRKHIAFGVCLLYAFSPFSSSQLFIAYGLTTLPLRYIVVPFFLGRLASYTLFTFSVSSLTTSIVANVHNVDFVAYFILAQLAGVGIIYIFTKLNWSELINNKKICFIK